MTENTNTPAQDDQDRRKVMQLYGAFAAGILLQFVPLPAAQVVGMVLIMGVLIGSYLMRRTKTPESLLWNHAAYISRTIWVWSFLLTIGVMAGGIWAGQASDASLLHQAMEQVFQGVVYDQTEAVGIIKDYIHANLKLFVMIGIFCISPSFFYLAYRLARGISRAAKGYRLSKPLAWF